MSKQIVFGHTVGTDNPTNITFFSGLLVGSSQHNSEPIVAPFSLTNIFIKVSVAPGGVTSRSWTLHKNDSATGCVITIAGTDVTGQYTSTPISYAVGDTIRWVRTVSGSPAAAITNITSELTPDTAGGQIYGFSTGSGATDGQIYPAMYGSAAGTNGDFPISTEIPVDGVIVALRFKVRTAPGAGKSYTLRVVKNTVTQDGAGGTVDTTLTLADTNVQAGSSFVLPVVAGDVVAFIQNNINSPAGSTWFGGNMLFIPTGNPVMTSMSFNPNANGADSYGYPVGANNTAQSATVQYITGGLQSFKLRTIRAKLSASPGAGNTRGFTLYVDGAPTALTVTIAEPDTAGLVSVVPPIQITSANVFSVLSTPVSTPSAADARVSLVEEAQSAPVNKGGKGGKGGIGGKGIYGPTLFNVYDAINPYGVN